MHAACSKCQAKLLHDVLCLSVQCWVNRPLSEDEDEQLQSVMGLAGHLAPALPLLAYELKASSEQLFFLHGLSEPGPIPALDKLAGSRYLQQAAGDEAGGWGPNPRQLLTPAEHARVLRAWPKTPTQAACMRQRLCSQVDVAPCPVAADVVGQHETTLAGLVADSLGSEDTPAYPLRVSEDATPLAQDMHKELAGSWKEYHQLPTRRLKLTHAQTAAIIRDRLVRWCFVLHCCVHLGTCFAH